MTQLDDRTTPTADDRRAPSRRQVLLTVGVVAAAAAVTAACGSSSASSSGATPAASKPAASGPAASTPAAGTPSGIPVAESDVPVGGGTILTDSKVVVTQPTKGTFKAFTAVCTHQGCTVASVANGTISCPCHGSTFSAADGSVTGGVAPAPLASIPVTVAGTTVFVQA